MIAPGIGLPLTTAGPTHIWYMCLCASLISSAGAAAVPMVTSREARTVSIRVGKSVRLIRIFRRLRVEAESSSDAESVARACYQYPLGAPQVFCCRRLGGWHR